MELAKRLLEGRTDIQMAMRTTESQMTFTRTMKRTMSVKMSRKQPQEAAKMLPKMRRWPRF